MSRTETLRRPNLAAEVAEHLAEDIISGNLAPGSPLREQHLVERLGVSRGTLREALLILERQQLAQLSPRRGARVAKLEADWVREVHEVWYRLFGLLLEHLCRAEIGVELARLQDEVQSLSTADREHFFLQIDGLVRALCELHGHGVLTRALMDLWPAARRCFHFALRQDQEEAEATRRFSELALGAAAAGELEALRGAWQSFAEAQLQRLLVSLERGPLQAEVVSE